MKAPARRAKAGKPPLAKRPVSRSPAPPAQEGCGGPWSEDIRSAVPLTPQSAASAEQSTHGRPSGPGRPLARQLRCALRKQRDTRGARILSGSLCSRRVSGVRLLQARGRGAAGRAPVGGGGAQQEGQGRHRSGVPGSGEGLGSRGSGADFGRPRVVLAAFSFPLNHWVGAAFPTDRPWFPAGSPPPRPPQAGQTPQFQMQLEVCFVWEVKGHSFSLSFPTLLCVNLP